MRRVRDTAFSDFLGRCRSALSAFTQDEFEVEHIVLLYRILSLLRSGTVTAAELYGSSDCLHKVFDRAYDVTHLPLFSDNYSSDVARDAFIFGLNEIMGTGAEGLPEVYFESLPVDWFGRAYQALIGRAERKKAGVYFTPDYLVRYVVDSSLEALLGGPHGQMLLFETPQTVEDIRVIDPAMGSGDFLLRSVEALAARWIDSHANPDVRTMESARPVIVRKCVFGLDLDPVSVDIARVSLALLAGWGNGPFDSLKENLRVGDTLLGFVDGLKTDGKGSPWPLCFPGACGTLRNPPGFDMVIGNPPYVASKNGELSAYAKLGEAGQSDSYLLFVKHVAESGLLRPGGVFSMILPDPLLERGNAKQVRDILFGRWTPVSLLHVAGAFRDAVVANAIPICRNSKMPDRTFRAARINYLSDRFAFASAPDDVFRRKSFEVDRDVLEMQPGREVLYLADAEFRRNVLSHIHGDLCRLSDYRFPFGPLSQIGVEQVFRGEEMGKSGISRNGGGGHPMLLGGQSVARYRINWEGSSILKVKKPLEWYRGLKIVIQKSAPRIIAALDDSDLNGGYVVPQSVYCIKPGSVDPLYLLAVLNSRPVNDYVFRVFTGYKMFQPQIELEDIKRLPIRLVERTTPSDELETLLDEGRELTLPAFRDGVSDQSAFVSFVEHRLNRIPEQADVLHDLLACFGQMMIALASENPTGEQERASHAERMSAGQRAIDIAVARLYAIPLTYALRL